MHSSRIRSWIIGLVVAIAVLSVATAVYATHAWGPYHWARTANPFTIKLGDNVSSAWDSYLATASADWSASSVLDTTVVAGASKGNCRPTKGRVEVCSKTYGYNGWLGLAQIWIDANNHITQGVTKMNDTYFNTSTYNTPAWKQFVVCQEVGHTFGLTHQDENFNNTNLGSCMDYTNDPDGTLSGQLSNLHPNQHDYDELVLIYSHLDSYTSLSALLPGGTGKGGLAAGVSPSVNVRDLGNGEKVVTFIYWTQ